MLAVPLRPALAKVAAALAVLAALLLLSLPPAAKAADPTPSPSPTTTDAPLDLPGLTGEDKRTVTVLVKPIEPFVIGDPDSGEDPTGFSVDLWNEIATRAGWKTKWMWTDTVTDQVLMVGEKRADVALGAITMTPEREAVIDFSLRVFSSNLGIITSSSAEPSSGFLAVIFSSQVRRAVQVILAAILGFGVLIFLLNRRQEDFPRGVRGLGNAFWLSGQAVMGKSFNNVFTGGKEPTRVFGRVMFLIWLWIAILLAGYIGGSITSVMTVKQLSSGITGPADLSNYSTIAPEGTTSDYSLTNLGVGHQVVPTYQDGLQALTEGKFQAMVFDRPVLQYWLRQNPGAGLRLVDATFGAEPYGFALQPDSDLRQQVNIGLLAVNQDGTYNEIYSHWFGEDASDSAG
ncbi:MAG: transporter substrate-binding domain-containing protein [Candidatus Nanopelagicales bacterium]